MYNNIFTKLSKLINKNREELSKILYKKDGTVVATNLYVLAEIKTNIDFEESVLLDAEIKDNEKPYNYICKDIDVKKYPDYQIAFPTGEIKAEVKVNVKLLKDLLNVFENTDDIDISLYGDNKAVVINKVFQAKNKNPFVIKGLIMPIKKD